jgi:hypothetical protein
MISRDWRPFVSPLQGDGHGGGRLPPFIQGGAPRLRRVALPWANLFFPFGAGRFLDAWPDSAGGKLLFGRP